MPAALVLDASVSVAWFLKETRERASYAAAVAELAAQGMVMHVPGQWEIEMGHVLLREYRRGSLRRAKLNQALEKLDALEIRAHLEPYSARDVVKLAERYHVQGYDALYLDLADALKLPLATLDDGQRQAASAQGIALFWP
ncbi:MAG: type II toxin-antitoxin system VapC family toxin [Betaproteobacteria bacterium]